MAKLPLLVTGAAGFIGARFIEKASSLGYPILSVDAPEYFESRTEHRGVPFGRIIPRDELQAWLRKEKPELHAVIHLGACTNTFEMDRDYLRKVNLEYSQALWNHCTETKTPLVYASSAATYGEGENGYDDNEELFSRLKPLNPYGESKLLFDIWALEQEKKGKHPPSWSGFKFFNVYGFGERHKGRMASVVLHAFDQIQKSGQVKLFRSHREGIADGEQRRDFIYVEDLVDVLLFAMQKPIPRGIYNLGTGQAGTFLSLVEAVFTSLGLEPRIDFIDTPVEIRDKYQYFTEAKMDRLRQQGYMKPFTPVKEGVRRYVERLKQTK